MGEWNLYFKNLVFLANRNLDYYNAYNYASLFPETYAFNNMNDSNHDGGVFFQILYASSSEKSQDAYYTYCFLNGTHMYPMPIVAQNRHYVLEISKGIKSYNYVYNPYNGSTENVKLFIRPFVHY